MCHATALPCHPTLPCHIVPTSTSSAMPVPLFLVPALCSPLPAFPVHATCAWTLVHYYHLVVVVPCWFCPCVVGFPILGWFPFCLTCLPAWVLIPGFATLHLLPLTHICGTTHMPHTFVHLYTPFAVPIYTPYHTNNNTAAPRAPAAYARCTLARCCARAPRCRPAILFALLFSPHQPRTRAPCCETRQRAGHRTTHPFAAFSTASHTHHCLLLVWSRATLSFNVLL